MKIFQENIVESVLSLELSNLILTRNFMTLLLWMMIKFAKFDREDFIKGWGVAHPILRERWNITVTKRFLSGSVSSDW